MITDPHVSRQWMKEPRVPVDASQQAAEPGGTCVDGRRSCWWDPTLTAVSSTWPEAAHLLPCWRPQSEYSHSRLCDSGREERQSVAKRHGRRSQLLISA